MYTVLRSLHGRHVTFNGVIQYYFAKVQQIFTGEIPYAGTKERAMYFAVLDRQLRPERPSSITNDDVWALIVRCWEHEPSLRLTFSSIHTELKAIIPASGKEFLNAVS